MRQNARIDILLSTYHGEHFVQPQIESVLEQTDAECRILIRDDNSSDGTLNLLRDFARRCPGRIVLLEDGGPRLGACGSFARLLQQADAEYVAFCDQDDVWLPGRIDLPLQHIQAAERQSGTDTPILAHTDLVVVDENLRPIDPSFWSYGNIDPWLGCSLNRLLVQNVVTGCATLINRALARRASPVPRSMPMHDWWLALVAAAFGRIETVPQKTVLYRQHSRNRLGATRYDWRYVIQRAQDVLCRGAVAQWYRTTQQQAEELLTRFHGELPPPKRALIAAYAELANAGFLGRRLRLLKHRFFKNGPLRNLGWLMMI